MASSFQSYSSEYRIPHFRNRKTRLILRSFREEGGGRRTNKPNTPYWYPIPPQTGCFVPWIFNTITEHRIDFAQNEFPNFGSHITSHTQQQILRIYFVRQQLPESRDSRRTHNNNTTFLFSTDTKAVVTKHTTCTLLYDKN